MCSISCDQFFLIFFFVECHRKRIVGQFESLRLCFDPKRNANDFWLEQKYAENCAGEQVEGWIGYFAWRQKSSFPVSFWRKIGIKIEFPTLWNILHCILLAKAQKCTWNIHKFMGHKRVAKKKEKGKSFFPFIILHPKGKSRHTNSGKSNFQVFLVLFKKSFPICINY